MIFPNKTDEFNQNVFRIKSFVKDKPVDVGRTEPVFTQTLT